MNDRSGVVTALLGSVLETSKRCGAAVFIVGGKVRDTLLAGSATFDTDIDLVVEGDACAFADDFARAISASVVSRSKFGTAKVKLPHTFSESALQISELDFASSRTEVYPHPGAQPTVQPASLLQDLSRRDFTINAMAAPIERLQELIQGVVNMSAFRGGVVDPLGGLGDLDRGVLRVIHERSFQDDPTRLLRGLRYKRRLNGAFDSATQGYFDQAVRGRALQTVSPQRVFAELTRWFPEPMAEDLFEELDWSAMLPSWGVDAEAKGVLARLARGAARESPEVKHTLWLRFAQQFIASEIRQKLNVSKAQWREVAEKFDDGDPLEHAHMRRLWSEAEAR
jgi:tRNA nucleotidyltransferase (CCA-adding enzyme)